MLQVTSEGRRGHGRRRLYEIPQLGRRRGGRVFQAMPGGNREGEELVGPEILAGGKKHPQGRCERDEEHDRPENQADCFHEGCRLMGR